MLWPYLSTLLFVGGCRCGGDREVAPPAPPAIEVRDAAGAVESRVIPGHPCRALIEGTELLVGGPPLVAQQGSVRWTAEDAPNGTTFRKGDAAVARLYARQLFDADGLPILRVLDDGRIANRASAIVRRAEVVPAAAPGPGAVAIGRTTVSGTTDVVLAAMLAAPEVPPDLRAIVACHLLLSEAR